MRTGPALPLVPLTLALLLSASPLQASGSSGYVVWVTDGDTLTVLDSNLDFTTIRIYGIDTPEKGQPYGYMAYAYTAYRSLARKVRIDPVEKDRYGRLVARLTVNGESLAALLIKRGAAWVYDRYCRSPECPRLRRLEEEARSAEKGLWGWTAEPIPPWVWRHRRR